MEELFRFNVLRAAERRQPRGIPLERTSQFQLVLAREALSNSPWQKMRTYALNTVSTSAAAWLSAFAIQPPSAEVMAAEGWPALQELPVLGELLETLKAVTSATPVERWRDAIKTVKGRVSVGQLRYLDDQLADLFLGLLLIRSAGPAVVDAAIRAKKLTPATAQLLRDRPSLDELASMLRLIDLLAITDAEIDALSVADLQAALDKTLLLPSALFSALEKPVHAVGIMDLLVVKQHVVRYEGGEIARIENVLQGETRGHSRKHTLSNERELFSQTEATTETDQELTTSDHVSLRNEAENTLKEDTKLNAGVHVQYDGGSFKMQSDFTVAYDKSSSESKKYASETAKDITQKAAKKVAQRITQSETTRIIETFEDNEEQSFENKGGKGHVVGVYQWVEKVYLAQVFNYGKRLMFDIMVPDPAASFRKQVQGVQDTIKNPTPPPPLTVSPTDLSPNLADQHFYGKLVAQYGATAVDAPPAANITLSVTKVIPYEDDTIKTGSDTLRIDDGYAALTGRVIVSWIRNDNAGGPGWGDPVPDSCVDVGVGGQWHRFPWPAGVSNRSDWQDQWTFPLNPAQPAVPLEQRTISYGFTTNRVNALTLTVEITCQRTPELLAKWQLQTYDKLHAAWEKLQDDYLAKLATVEQQKENVPLFNASDPETNRQIERTELKRSCIAILDNAYTWAHGLQATQPWVHGVDPDLGASSAGAWVRWFEQAFEWDKIGYLFYPYFWADSAQWTDMLSIKHDDALFLKFLQAGYARVTIPVRSGFEAAVSFYMLTGVPWLGGGLPSIGDTGQNPLYLSIVDEIKESSGAPGNELPVDDPWEIRLPTMLVKLRKETDGTTPTWSRAIGPSAAPDTAWTWKPDEPPK